MHYLLEEGNATMEDVNNNGEFAWNLLTGHSEEPANKIS
jgi:hypothetical protein